ncbi:uncharacterized protein EKO05_0006230 [Ascochyta rabiei]|uniref:Peroxidase n=1 Tax=Didymella rabiei TaxID=5454 RepID=A0A163AW78_DIDRA|nr:uncharacterized protein EKO05_0006230 [Ascochyta rabiei]KZM21430.1 peroxidase [Ascochyta rabiei]UPX15791.1 hypothetical protein EKO05_0006230 [Ascochyta rabiei]
MSSEGTPLLAGHVPKGMYVPAGPDDKRSPCPMVNSLANHGYLPRDGRNVLAHEIKAAMNEAGISATLNALFVNAIYNVHKEKDEKDKLLSRVWTTACDPWTLLSRFGMRRPGQTDSFGRPILDLDQLALPGAVEHDISLTRRDHDQKEGNCARQEDLVDDLLASSTDRKNITREGLAGLRRRRIATQREDNPGLTYGPLQHEMSCGEIALILGVFGDGKSAPYDFVAPFLQEERLPIKEGWTKRWWWTLGLVEVKIIATQVKSLIGLQIE